MYPDSMIFCTYFELLGSSVILESRVAECSLILLKLG